MKPRATITGVSDTAIGELKANMDRIEGVVTDIKLLLGKQNGARSYARTGGIGVGGAGAAWVLLEGAARLLGGG